jgi:hypothetical protein
MSLKNPVTPPGIDPETVGLVPQRLNHYAKAKRGYWKLKEGALDHTFWRTSFGSGYGPVEIETNE